MSVATPGDGPWEPAVAPDPAGFVATTVAVDPSTWSTTSAAVLAEAADAGMLVVGRDRTLAATGVAATLPLPGGLEDAEALPAVRAWLAAVEHTDGAERRTPSTGPPGAMAIGAFPFERASPAFLVVPSATWCRDGRGRVWRVEVRQRAQRAQSQAGPARRPGRLEDEARGTTVGGADPGAAAREPCELEQVPEPAGYLDAVSHALGDIRDGVLRKVVLGRMVRLQLPDWPVPSRLLRTLWDDDDVFLAFSVPTPTGRLVGASPELVIARRGRNVTSHAFAGTVGLLDPGASGDGQRLLDSMKDRTEHELVVEEIVGTLGPRCADLQVPEEPTVVRLRSDARLGTLIRGTLTARPSPGGTALTLLALLHPTPAVGGVPRAAALDLIAALEAAPRGYWAGAVGWTDGAGDGEWVLGIRSVELEGRRALVRAGAGIVATSDPRAELAETNVKLRPVLDALWPGASALL
ncbi:MAG: chorismate-binding protein [Actinomycetota bacterium]|nr:chorismate-binding protein [Actinomycetota bacterium]